MQNVLAINGFDLLGGGNKTNAATMFVPLKPWEERPSAPAQKVAARSSSPKGRSSATA